MNVGLVIGPISSWPDDWLDRASRLCAATAANSKRAGHALDPSLADDLSMLNVERTRRRPLP